MTVARVMAILGLLLVGLLGLGMSVCGDGFTVLALASLMLARERAAGPIATSSSHCRPCPC
jgi:hypothetical protein